MRNSYLSRWNPWGPLIKLASGRMEGCNECRATLKLRLLWHFFSCWQLSSSRNLVKECYWLSQSRCCFSGMMHSALNCETSYTPYVHVILRSSGRITLISCSTCPNDVMRLVISSKDKVHDNLRYSWQTFLVPSLHPNGGMSGRSSNEGIVTDGIAKNKITQQMKNVLAYFVMNEDGGSLSIPPEIVSTSIDRGRPDRLLMVLLLVFLIRLKPFFIPFLEIPILFPSFWIPEYWFLPLVEVDRNERMLLLDRFDNFFFKLMRLDLLLSTVSLYPPREERSDLVNLKLAEEDIVSMDLRNTILDAALIS